MYLEDQFHAKWTGVWISHLLTLASFIPNHLYPSLASLVNAVIPHSGASDAMSQSQYGSFSAAGGSGGAGDGGGWQKRLKHSERIG